MTTHYETNQSVRKILLEGRLLQITESLALRLSNQFDFAKRIVQEFALILAGQALKYLNIGQRDRAYSHAGIYAPPGLGKDFSWKLIETSSIFPLDIVRVHRLENITEAALIGTVTESTIVPPPAVTEDIIFVGEYATFMRGPNASSVAADMRSMIENGEYRRRLAKLAYFKEILYAPGEEWKKKYLQDQLEYYRKQGMSIDLDRAEIHIRTTTSWMIASARFGSPSIEGRPLLSMGDVTRYRWRCFIPSEQERFQITSEVGGLPPETVSGTEKRSCCEAWKVLISALRKNVVDGSVMVPRDEASFQSRKEIWNQTVREMTDLYGEKMSEVYLEQLVNLRTRAEFTRIMYQHAALKQFERSQGYDFVLPSKFIINYDEDGEFARQLWLSEYVPSMMSVIDDITHFAHSWRGRRIATSTQRGEEIILKRLEKGPADHGELEKLVREAGITASLLNNYILPGLIRKGLICKPTGYKLYRVRDCKNCQYRETCPHKENENQRSAGGGLHG